MIARPPIGRHVAAWLLLPFAAALNGTMRDFTYGTTMSETASHSLSVIPLLLVIAAWAAYLAARRPLPDRRAAVTVGVVWLVLTLAFETTLGLLRGVPLARIAVEYDVTRGHLWILIPLATLLAPVLARRLVHAPPRVASAVS